MLTVLIIILALLGAAIIGSIYSNFLVFHSNFSESENYHKAYYASISALERGELVIKQRQPGYIGSGGIISGKGGTGSRADGGSDKSLSGFSYLSGGKITPTVFRTINSRTNRIPKEGEGNVEGMLRSGDSKNYNMMDYENAEVFLLYYDDSSENPYTTSNISKDSYEKITGVVRLPEKLKAKFGDLDTETSLVGNDVNLPRDDAIVDRQIKGKSESNRPFTVYSTQNTNGYNTVLYHYDSAFRESEINNPLNFKFSNNKLPIVANDIGVLTGLTVVSQDPNIKNRNFKDIFSDGTYSNVQLRFSLLNLLQSTSGYIYPFLEYYIDFNGKNVADKYYTINAEGSFKDYQINSIIQKPTVKESILGNFTSIF